MKTALLVVVALKKLHRAGTIYSLDYDHPAMVEARQALHQALTDPEILRQMDETAKEAGCLYSAGLRELARKLRTPGEEPTDHEVNMLDSLALVLEEQQEDVLDLKLTDLG